MRKIFSVSRFPLRIFEAVNIGPLEEGMRDRWRVCDIASNTYSVVHSVDEYVGRFDLGEITDLIETER